MPTRLTSHWMRWSTHSLSAALGMCGLCLSSARTSSFHCRRERPADCGSLVCDTCCEMLDALRLPRVRAEPAANSSSSWSAGSTFSALRGGDVGGVTRSTTL